MASASSSRLATPSGPSREGSSAPAASSTDLYRPLASAVQKPLAPLLGNVGDTSLPTVLGLDGDTYQSRLSGKTVLLTDIPSSGSSLLSGKKRNKGNPAAVVAAREATDKIARERRGCGVVGRKRKHQAVTSPDTRINYAALVPLHYLHIRYLSQCCNLPQAETPQGPPARGPALLPGVSPEALQSKLVKADMTGAKMSVRAARNPSLVGLSGIVIEETAGSIRLVGEDSRLRVIPKIGTQFTLRFPAYACGASREDMAEHIASTPQIEIDILGTAFAYRSGDRAGRKFRPAQGGGGGSGWAEEWVQAEWGDVLRKIHESDEKVDIKSNRRKRNKSRRKDPLAFGSVQVF